VCDGCGMTIAELRYAAAIVADDGADRRMMIFDDIGCLARWESTADRSTIRKRWVHDRESGGWIEADSATFVQIQELATPMGSGIAAFKTASSAQALAAERGGEQLSWAAILAEARDGTLHAHPHALHEAGP
jgi:copper chaperone NosL